ncbi:TPA: hypothetical protein QCR57_005961 [Bacillus cereus]|nr:hypothetical protein [Bacillus thuringiensis]HDR4766695.1 hypothetical protein [Bacillus cereus]HDR4799671.1 hypothetical protein [Bacillus cereus]HDR4805776.1 hypothetical protein [Bacillus cereus]HDR4811712.1 hypothetical protein [Bacillus cereus]
MRNVTWIGVNKKEITDENIQRVEQYFNIRFTFIFSFKLQHIHGQKQ